MRQLVREHFRFFLFAFLAALSLRLFFFFCLPRITDDSLVYGDIARNWLQHGVYGLTELGEVVPTCIRLPGYPAFLAVIFAIFGVGHYKMVWILQILFDLATCFLIADMARRMVSSRAAKAAFLLAGLCPFLANYSAAALTETLEIFCTALALDCALIGIGNSSSRRLLPWFGCGLATGAAILLRPDGGLLLIAIAGYLSWKWLRSGNQNQNAFTRAYLIRAACVVLCAALAPLVPWTLRNLHTLHELQPLAPRYSNDSDEFVSMGFNCWVKTWMADYVSVEEIYWAVPGGSVDVEKLPHRAFDSAQQRAQTAQLFAEYNRDRRMTPALDAVLAKLTSERIHAAPLRYYLWLPLLRIADMWLRPRTELLPVDTRWWEFNDDPLPVAATLFLGVVGLLYPALALAGWRSGQFSAGLGLLLVFVFLRSAFLGTLENPEPRYVLECYPVAIVLASAVFRRIPKTVS